VSADPGIFALPPSLDVVKVESPLETGLAWLFVKSRLPCHHSHLINTAAPSSFSLTSFPLLSTLNGFSALRN
jgi:hypothetical protein